jgi:hypothetical protein
LWVIQTRQEELKGEPANKVATAIWAFLIVIAVGWFVTAAFISDQAVMVLGSRNIESFDDFEKIYLGKIDKDALKDLGVSTETLDTFNSTGAIADYKNELADRIDNKEVTDPAEIENIRNQINILNAGAITICSVEKSAGEINAASQLRARPGLCRR